MLFVIGFIIGVFIGVMVTLILTAEDPSVDYLKDLND